jgi:histidine triad (HIT) family protein
VSNNTSAECVVCRKHRGEIAVPEGVFFENALIYISHTQFFGEEKDKYLGHIIVESKRHVAELADLTDMEA